MSKLISTASRRLQLAILLCVALLCRATAQAQNVRDERGTGGSLNRAFMKAADEQNRADWPLKSRGRPGTAVRLTFDPQNADADLITDRSYGTERLLAMAQELSAAMDLPRTDFIRSPDVTNATNVDMEFNRHLRSEEH